MNQRSSPNAARGMQQPTTDVEIEWRCVEWTPAQRLGWRRFWGRVFMAARATQPADPVAAPTRSNAQAAFIHREGNNDGGVGREDVD